MILGWDIGGVNTKLACVEGGRVRQVISRPFELQRAPESLVALLRDMAAAVGAVGGSAARNPPYVRGPGSAAGGESAARNPPYVRRPGSAAGDAPADPAVHAITMTAELSQLFRTKREGVHFVLDALCTAFPGSRQHVYTSCGTFVAPPVARERPLDVAAANWMATAAIVAKTHPDALLVDVGTTTTDIIPIVGGRVAAQGRTDPGRLASGELVYSGAVRTPVEAIVTEVPFASALAGVSAEGFALSGDAHVWRGGLVPADYCSPTPDGRPATREFARERLARVVCGDVEMLDDGAISAIADAIAEAQVTRICAAVSRVRSAHPSVRMAVVTGLGAFIADAAARRAGLTVAELAGSLGDAAARCAPAAAVALLLDDLDGA